MYDVLETPTYFEWEIPATDTAKISLLCFDDEEELDDWECLLNDCRRKLSENTKSLGGVRNLEHPPSQVCYFEYLGFPDFDHSRKLKDATALDTGDRKLYHGVHNAGLAYVYKEDHPFIEEKDICVAYFDDEDNYWGLDASAIEVRKGVLAIQSELETEFPYFAFKTTSK
jgi:hypothetical protein